MAIDTDHLLAVLPHYAAMLLLALVSVQIVGSFFENVGFWQEFAVILVVVFAYRPIVARLGFEPEPWANQRK